jgi:rhamnogalacturonan endolyase
VKNHHKIAATATLAGLVGAVFAASSSDGVRADEVTVVKGAGAVSTTMLASGFMQNPASSSAATSAPTTGWTAATLQSSCTTTIAAAPMPDQAATASFGMTSDANFFIVDTGAGLVFKIRRVPNSASTLAIGDISSMLYKGVEYQDQARGTQLNSGAGFLYKGIDEPQVGVTAQQIGTDYIKITVDIGDMTHYYIAHRGEAKIYMGTVFSREPDQTELVRYIVRAQKARVPNGPPQSDLKDTNRAIESGDIFGLPNGETRSKHYANDRLRDWYYIGATGTNVGLWIVRGNSEQWAGGPFYRSLLNQGTTTNQEVTYVMHYGMAQTEAFRFNALQTYALVFNDGATPAPIDTSWYDGLDLKGWTPLAGRGTVTGTGIVGGDDRSRTTGLSGSRLLGTGIVGRDTRSRYTVGFSNDTAQYYTTPSSAGAFSCAGMLPGTYTMSVFKNELLVGSRAVTVAAGTATTINAPTITDPSATPALWRIGDWDGSPQELRNGGFLTLMHPSDVRLASWTPGPFTVGASTAAQFPAYQWKAINNSQVVRFRLTADQLKASQVRIGTTIAQNGARPVVTVNSWSSPFPAAPTQPKTRNLTVGTYRGNNNLYTFNVPASALVVGDNTMTISVISGTVADAWLSPGVSYDAIDFVQ